MFSRLISNWVSGGSKAGVILLLLFPLLSKNWTLIEALTFLHLPAYMLHQWEEHTNDRFRLFVNSKIGKGLEVLSPFAVFIINVPGVWGVLSATILLTFVAHPGFALIAIWLVLINGVAHIVQAIAMKKYNPGLITATLIFMPLSLLSMKESVSGGTGSAMFQALGLGLSIAIHAAIILHILREKRRLSATRH